MSAFYTLKVNAIQRETADSVAISFDVPDELKEKFVFLPGQYLTLKLQLEGAEIRRSYSICSSPLFGEKLGVAVKKVKAGKASTYLNEQLKVGDSLEVMTPMGNFYPSISGNNSKIYYLFAGGSGITPMMSIMKSVLKSEPNSKVNLFYGNESNAAIIFAQHLKQLQNEFPESLQVYHILNQPVSEHHPDFKGIMDAAKNALLVEKFVDMRAKNEFFICGPGPMMDAVVQTLKSKEVAAAQIHVEYFVAPEVSAAPNVSDTAAAIETEATIICDGDEIKLRISPEQSVLEAALAAGLDAPYACQGGSCCTCRALLVEGKVHMKVNYALLDSEVKEGFILTCQSHALTPTLVVDYDRGR